MPGEGKKGFGEGVEGDGEKGRQKDVRVRDY